jgi:hypothetical protein
MTSDQQKKLVSDLINRVANDIIDRIHLGRIPESWDGAELRQYVSDQFHVECFGLSGKRRKEYDNDVIVNNL